ncbi:amidohydrolase family protein [Rhodoferax ferrireducens]|uniref:amidohydrolase family protein n=1 Tax=Rhodoferax ferrireducens TaxID=192843 RepID=UPI000E0DF93F|nr:amidohydrolase family protein [Rhodoferax ferrireducens]
MKKTLIATGWVGLSLAALADPLVLIDTHAHFQTIPFKDLEASHRTALKQMDQMNIGKSLLMPQPFATNTPKWFYDIEDLLFAAKANPDRFAVLGGSTLNVMLHSTAAEAVDDGIRSKFRERAQKIVSLGAVGFGEISVLHVSIPAMGANHAYEMVPADHPLLLMLADIAAENDIPIDLHCDLVPQDMPLPENLRANHLNPPELQGNLPAFKRLLAHNPKTKIVWVHVGFEPLLTRHPKRVRALLQEHPNLFMSFRLNRGHPSPAAAMDMDGKLKSSWIDLVHEFPDRFMLGSDAFYDRNGIARGSGDDGMNNLRGLITQLPEPLAAQVASENAIRLYRLKALATQ